MTLEDFFREYKKCSIAFSGGVDSAYLLYEAIRLGADVRAYYVRSAFQPRFELMDALRLANELNADMNILEADVLSDTTITDNPADRCYHCKNTIFNTIMKAAEKDGYLPLFDGTNASDDASDRPGMRALQELKVMSPLRLCGLTKDEIRKRSRDARLFTWDKPAYACLATRLPAGVRITSGRLHKTEEAESYLFEKGFTDFRVRLMETAAGDVARIQVRAEQLDRLLLLREEILSELRRHYAGVVLDMEARS